MTNVPEAYLAKEAGMNYTTIAMITDYDAWKEEHCTVEEIMNVMKQNYQSAQQLLELVIPKIMKSKISTPKDNQHAVMTSPKFINESNQKILETLLK